MADFQREVATAQQANLDFFFALADSMLEGEEKLVRFNLDTAKTTLADWYQRAQDGLERKDSQEVTGLRGALTLHPAEKFLTYERQVAEIASSTQAQLAKAVNARCQEASLQVQSFVENLAQNAPVGSEAAIAFLKQAITLANTTQESVQKATMQAVEVAQSNLEAATKVASNVTEAADQAIEKAAKAAKR